MCVCVCVCSSHRCLPVCIRQYPVDPDLALVQRVQIYPQVFSPSVCWTVTLPSVVPVGVLRERGHLLGKCMLEDEVVLGLYLFNYTFDSI